ncbi:MAG: patatin-like phospholipase family protein [Actinomycetota bacterium]|nr:patatin-like phospholipase family protein [Actinomycetota bacterium]
MRDVLQADLVLAGGGVKGIGHVGAISALNEAGYEFPRVAGTSAGSIVAALVAAGLSPARMTGVMRELTWPRFKDPSLLDRVPALGPLISVAREYGLYEGEYLKTWLGDLLAERGVRTFGDLVNPDATGDEDRYRLVVMAADITRGELIRLPWDYQRYGLDPDEQLVVDAVRASMSIPLFYEPARLRAADGSVSTLVDGGLLSNFPVDVFDREDGRAPRRPTFGVTLFPKLPEGNVRLFPLPGPLRRGLPHHVECLVTSAIVGRDQGHLAKPWVAARTIEVKTDDVGVVEFDIGPEERDMALESGRAAATAFLASWDFEAYRRRFRPSA